MRCRVGLPGRSIKGDGNYTTEIDKVLTLELLHRLFLDAQYLALGASLLGKTLNAA